MSVKKFFTEVTEREHSHKNIRYFLFRIVFVKQLHVVFLSVTCTIFEKIPFI